jgi:hypothetical protein
MFINTIEKEKKMRAYRTGSIILRSNSTSNSQINKWAVISAIYKVKARLKMPKRLKKVSKQ